MFSQQTNDKIRDLQDALQALESLELPEKFKSAPANLAVLERYKQSRKRHFERHIVKAYLDGDNNQRVPTRQEWQDLENRKEQVQALIQGLMQQIEHKIPQLQAQYSTVQSRQEEMRQVLNDLQEHNIQEHDNDDDDIADMPDVTEEQLQAQEEKLEQLQQRKVQVLSELSNIRKENTKLQLKIQQSQTTLMRDHDFVDFDSITPELVKEYENKTKECTEKLENYKKIKEYYSGLRETMQELSGIKVSKVKKSSDGLTMHVELLQKHTLQINLATTNASSKRNLRVQNACWTTSTILNGPKNEAGHVSFSMNIPSVDDLVLLAAPLPPGDDLRFLLSQSVARVTCLTRRVAELSLLQQQPDIIVKIGQKYHDPQGFAGQDQEVICSINSTMLTVVLRLGPECPVMPNSVTIEKLVALNGWDEVLLQELKDEILQRLDNSASPVNVIRCLQATLAQWIEQGKLRMPMTPRLPQRPGGF